MSGIFDNITIQNNEIITTDTDGPLALTPDGDGPVNVGSTGVTVDLVDIFNALNVGSNDPANEPHMAFDEDQIQTKTDDTTAGAALRLQPLGGEVEIYSGAVLVMAGDTDIDMSAVKALAKKSVDEIMKETKKK